MGNSTSNWVIEFISLVVLYEPCGFVKKFNRNLGNIVCFFSFQLSFGGIVCWCIICECDMTPAKFRASLHMIMHQQEMKIPGFGVL